MPRNRAHLETQVRQINQLFSNPHVIEITKPCTLHNRRASFEVFNRFPKANSVDKELTSSERPTPVQRRAKSVDHTGLQRQKRLQNRNSISSANDLLSGKYVDITNHPEFLDGISKSERELRRRSYFDGMEHPADFPSQLRNFQTLSLSKSKLNQNGSTHNHHNILHHHINKSTELIKNGDSNNNNRQNSASPEKYTVADTENYLRKPKRLSFDVINENENINTNNNNNHHHHLTTSGTTNRKMSLSSTDSLDYIRSPSRRYSSHSSSLNSASSPKNYFDSANIEREVRETKILIKITKDQMLKKYTILNE